jgi:hypothetical protein
MAWRGHGPSWRLAEDELPDRRDEVLDCRALPSSVVIRDRTASRLAELELRTLVFSLMVLGGPPKILSFGRLANRIY